MSKVAINIRVLYSWHRRNTEDQETLLGTRHHALDTSEEMGKFQETDNLPALNYEKTENLSKPITSKETESIIKNLPT